MTRTATPLDSTPGVPDSHVLPPSSEAERAFGDSLNNISREIHHQLQEGRTRLRATLLEPLEQTVREAAAIHRRIAEQARFADGEVGDKDLWLRVAAYRDAVQTQIIGTIGRQLTEGELGHAMSQTWLETLQRIANAGSTVEVEVRVPEDTTLFESDDSDSAWHRLRKFEVRTRRRLSAFPRTVVDGLRKLVRRPPREATGYTRLVPVRPIVNYHLQVRIPEVLRGIHDNQQQAVAQRVAQLENAVTAWTYDVLGAEAALDRAVFHRPESLRSDAAEDPSDAAEADRDEDPPTRPELEQFAAALQTALDAATEHPLEIAVDEEPLEAAAAALTNDMTRAGTFLLDLGSRRLPVAAKSPAASISVQQGLWSDWYREVSNRFELNRRLIAFRQELREVTESFLRRITTATIEPVYASFEAIKNKLQTAQQQTERACDDADTTGSASELPRSLRKIQSSTLRQLQAAWRDLPGLVSSDQALSNPGLEEWQTIVDVIGQLPDELSLHSPQPEDETEVVPGKRAITLDLRQIAKDAMSLPLPDQLTDEADALKRRVIEVWTATEKVQDIVKYNLGAALDELEAAGESGDRDRDESATASAADDASPQTPIGAARQLIVDGLRRAASTLSELEQSLWPPWQVLAEAVFEHVHDDWLALHKRISAEAAIEERWLGFQTRAARWAEGTWRGVEDQWQQFRRRVGTAAASSARRVKRLIKRGQVAVGVSEAGEDSTAATLDAIADIRTLRTKLPLVYRRLFSFEPLTEPSLFEGRSRDLVWIRQHFSRWQDGRNPGILVLTAPLGQGRTSVLNVLAATVFEKTEVHRLDLSARITETSEFATVVAKALGLEWSEGATLDDLESLLAERRQPERPHVCLIDNLEHCLFAAPGKTALIDRVMIFLSRTDASVYWAATIGSLAWQFVQKTAPSSAGLVTEFALPPLDRKALEDLISNRHGRSGMPLRFAGPSNPSPLLKQRLRRAKTPAKRQLLLREVYFDSLSKASGGSVLLALFYWLRSTDFDAEPDVLTINPLRPLDFKFLSGLDLTRAFTLKTFLIHNTLSPPEHAQVLRLSSDDSLFVLESLLNKRIIESAASTREDAPVSRTRVVPTDRYQIRQLLVHPIIEFLKDRNIIY